MSLCPQMPLASISTRIDVSSCVPSSTSCRASPPHLLTSISTRSDALGIEAAMSTTYHPQTNGQTEWVNQELEQYLRIFVRERQDDWYALLPLAEFSYNNHIHLSTQQTPFLLDTGWHPQIGFELHQPPFRWSGCCVSDYKTNKLTQNRSLSRS